MRTPKGSMPEQTGGYATRLLNLLAPSEAAEKRPRRRAREKALYPGIVTHPDQIVLGNLLREIGEISTRNTSLNRSGFANLLKKRPKYNHLSLRTLRRYVRNLRDRVDGESVAADPAAPLVEVSRHRPATGDDEARPLRKVA